MTAKTSGSAPNSCLIEVEKYDLAENKQVATTVTDEFGEYKIDGLQAGIGVCKIRITHENYSIKTLSITINDTSVVVERLLLEENTASKKSVMADSLRAEQMI